MRKILMATSALVLLGASAGFAQDFEPTDMNDEPTPDVIDDGDVYEPGLTTGSTTTGPQPLRWLNRGFQAADGFRPSDQNDLQAPDFAAEREIFDEGIAVAGMEPAAPVVPLDQGVAAAQGVQPSDQGDDQAPDFAEGQEIFDEGATTASATDIDTTVTTGSIASVPDPAVQYVVANPIEPVMLEGGLSTGMTLPETVALRPIPEYPQFAYVYLDDGPAVVDANTRTIVWVR